MMGPLEELSQPPGRVWGESLVTFQRRWTGQLPRQVSPESKRAEAIYEANVAQDRFAATLRTKRESLEQMPYGDDGREQRFMKIEKLRNHETELENFNGTR